MHDDYEEDYGDEDDYGCGFARGVMSALVISALMWYAIVSFVEYLL